MAYNPDDIPKCLKHMTLAIMRGGTLRDPAGSVTTGSLAKFQKAFEIARSRLAQYGYLANGSQNGPPSKIRLTPKGKHLEMEHVKEGMRGPAKNKAFDALFVALYRDPTPTEKAKGEAQPKDQKTVTTMKHPEKAKPKTKLTSAKDEF